MPLHSLKHVVQGVKNLVKQTASGSTSLENATLANTPKFGLETFGKRARVRVIDVYDGDTLTIAMELYGTVSAFRVRLAHIDTPELKPAMNLPDRAEVVARGKAGRDHLISLVLGHIVWIDILGYEKYGRLLADLYINETDTISVNERMITDGYGTAYEGGTK